MRKEIIPKAPAPRDICDPSTELFPSRFRLKFTVNEETGCWEWIAGISPKGYGQFRHIGSNGRRRSGAHQFSYEAVVGPIPDTLQIDHLCEVKNCVNPGHLEAVTSLVNILRSKNQGALNARKTHCPEGHEYDRLTSDGKRFCRRCKSRAQATVVREQKAQDRQADLDNPTVYQRDPEQSSWLAGSWWHWPQRTDPTVSACGKVPLDGESGADQDGIQGDKKCRRSGCLRRWKES